MRLRLAVLALTLTLGSCSWLGLGGKAPEKAASSELTSDEVLKRDCQDETWKKQNLGLWYSVCRQPMRW